MLEHVLGLPEGEVVGAERRPTVARDEPGCVEVGREVALALNEGEAPEEAKVPEALLRHLFRL